MKLVAPAPLTSKHNISAFSCGEPVLDAWLQKKALKAQKDRSARVFVLCDSGNRVVGYYALANGALARGDALGGVRRNMPDPIPVMVLARFAIDSLLQGQGIGQELLRNAILRTLSAAEIAGIRAIVVHALTDQAKLFYENCGFKASTENPYLLMAKLTDFELEY